MASCDDWLFERWRETHPVDGAWFAELDRVAIGLETIARILGRDSTLRSAGHEDLTLSDYDTEGLHEAAIALASNLTNAFSRRREREQGAANG